jgi:hypothetical protein
MELRSLSPVLDGLGVEGVGSRHPGALTRFRLQPVEIWPGVVVKAMLCALVAKLPRAFWSRGPGVSHTRLWGGVLQFHI